ncbi:hypothetical protein ACFZCM_31545 [Streptomyces rochei]|uniref:hypothetical protein n=1 Tax=Streptomyces rochei TaxID=1928 RepID=UPI0036E295EC
MTERPPHSPCRRNDRHDAHEFEVYGRPFWCPGFTPASSPPADQTGLRDRIAEALIAWTYRGKDPEHGGILETVRANAYSRADAVLAVLPAPADRAAVASAPVRKTLRRWAYAAGHIEAELDGAVDRMYELIARDVRRMAGETATTETQATAPAETDEERADREETERDHARGDHTHCGLTCEVQMPTEHLRNFVIAKGYPGTKGALAELERRAAAGARQDGAQR